MSLTLFAATDLYAAPFYEGKIVRVTVGFSAGGGFDLWARVVARHLGRNIPGQSHGHRGEHHRSGRPHPDEQALQGDQAGRTDHRPHQRRTYPEPDDGPAGVRLRQPEVHLHRRRQQGEHRIRLRQEERHDLGRQVADLVRRLSRSAAL